MSSGDFAALDRELRPTVASVVRRIIRNEDTAEETVQDVLFEIWRLGDRFDPSRGSHQAWAGTIAHRRAVDRVRADVARAAREDRVHHLDPPPPTDPVGDAVSDRIDRDRVRAALEDLSDVQREAVVLAFYGRHSYRSVATRLGAPEGTVKRRIRDGLRVLAGSLADQPASGRSARARVRWSDARSDSPRAS